MAMFKKKDREKRRGSKALHASAMKYAVNTWHYSDEPDPKNQLQKAYEAYVFRSSELGIRPLSFGTFKKEFKP